jgi:hypothetical protein
VQGMLIEQEALTMNDAVLQALLEVQGQAHTSIAQQRGEVAADASALASSGHTPAESGAPGLMAADYTLEEHPTEELMLCACLEGADPVVLARHGDVMAAARPDIRMVECPSGSGKW